MINEQPQLFWGVIGSMYIGNVMLLALNLPLISLWVRLLTIPYRYLAVLVVVICSVGAYSVTSNILDVGIMVLFGVFGYLMRKGGFPAVPLVLAMILGRILELSVQQSLIMSGGDVLIFTQKPISAALLLVAGFVLITPILQYLRRKKTAPQKA